MGIRDILCCNRHTPWLLGRLSPTDLVVDGFYEPVGDFPEVVDKGYFPSLAALGHVQAFEADPREVRVACCSCCCCFIGRERQRLRGQRGAPVSLTYTMP